MKKDIVVVIPAYEPNQSLLQVLDGVTSTLSGCSIVLVDDGSTGSKDIFERAEGYKNLTLIRHPHNKGKGAALKTAFAYLKEQGGDKIIVTADADGQHKPEDIQKVANTYIETGEGLVLGSRKFEGKIPFKSTFGNVVARGLLRLCNHRHLHDTQTGLRAFGSELLPFMLSIGGNKYEYEMNVLVRCVRCDVPIRETAIATIYI
ncbi:MAG: glycosyltransferase family 2 protein, partial [Candidatus Coproplasma sp.]